MAIIAPSTTEQPKIGLTAEAQGALSSFAVVARARADKPLLDLRPKPAKVTKARAPPHPSPPSSLKTPTGKDPKSLGAPQKSASEEVDGWKSVEEAAGYLGPKEEEFWGSEEELNAIKQNALKERAKEKARQLRQQLLAAVVPAAATKIATPVDGWVEVKNRRKQCWDAKVPPVIPISEARRQANSSQKKSKPSRPSQKKRRKAAVKALEAKTAILGAPAVPEATPTTDGQETDGQSDTASEATTDDLSVAETCCEPPDNLATCDNLKISVAEPPPVNVLEPPPVNVLEPEEIEDADGDAETVVVRETRGKRRQHRSGASKKKRRKQQKAAQESSGILGKLLKGALSAIAGTLIIGGAIQAFLG